MIRFFAAHRTVANLLMVLFLLWGLFVGPSLLHDTFPPTQPTDVEITVPYPGARPEDVETAICQPIENALDAVTGIDTQSCEAREGLARAVATMKEGENFQAFTADVKTEIDAISNFPANADPAKVKPLGLTSFVASVAITGPKSRTDLEAYAEQIRTRMLRWGGIPKVNIRGFSTRQLRIGLHPAALRRFGISVSDAARAIRSASLDLPAGSIKTDTETLLIRVAEQRQTPQALASLIVRSSASGGQVRLGDIADISRQFEQDSDNAILFDGKPAAVLDITKTRADDSLRVIDAVKGFLASARKQAPPGVMMKVTADGASVVRTRLNLVERNGLEGLALVFLVLWLFFGLRFSFWVAMGLPVSVMGGIALMWLAGYSMNMMTALGLLVVVGLLMDDAIVIAENIVRLREKGLSAFESAVQGTEQVFTDVLASFLTTAMVFGSLAFLSGNIGAVLRVVPVVMLFVLSVSLVEAYLILPHHLLHTLETPRREGGVRHAVERTMTFTRERLVGPLVDLSIRWRYLVTGLALALLLVAVGMVMGGYLKIIAFPKLDGDTIAARILLPQGTPLARTKVVVARVQHGLMQINKRLSQQQPGGAPLVRHVSVSYGLNRDAFESGPNVATVSVDLLASSVRTLTSDAIMAAWRKEVGKVADVISLKYAETRLGPAGVAIDMRLKGDDLARLKKASLELQTWLWKYNGVTSVMDDLRPGKRELRITLARSAGPMGVTASLIADQLRAAYYGTTISEVQINGQRVDVTAQFDAHDKGAMRQFDNFVITRPDGSTVPLSVVARVNIGQGWNRINHEGGVRTVTIQGTIDTRFANTNAILGDTLARFMPGLLKRYPGVKLDIEGQRAEAKKTQKSMLKGFAIGLIGVFFLLSFLFQSYVEPIVVMLVIPLSLIGAIFGHMAMGLDFSMPSILGYVALAGVVVNDSILLVDFVKHEHGPSLTVAVAAGKAARSRFRAIFLTSLTTIAGLLPILYETDKQAQILKPLVTSVTFGLLASTLVVLFVLPGFYAILDDLGLSTLARERREKSAHD